MLLLTPVRINSGFKGAVSQNSAKLGITKRPLNPRET